MALSDIQIALNMTNQYVRNYAVDSYKDQRLNTILNIILNNLAGLVGNVNANIGNAPILVTSANFINATDCPLTAFAGLQLAVFWNDQNRYLKESTDWTPLSGGGFQILIPGFNSADGSYEFYVAS